MINAVIINDIDTVVTVIKKVSLGENVSYVSSDGYSTIKATSDIPINHKVAIKQVKNGDEVLKYGERIGYATMDIHIGDHVHTNNLDS